MPLDKLDDVTSFGPENVPVLKNILDKMARDTPNVRYTTTTPTSSTVRHGEFVIYDDQASTATRRCYFKTGDGTLVYTMTFIDDVAQD